MVRRFLLACFLSFMISGLAQAKDLRFVQVAETQYSVNNTEKLERCVKDINSLKKIDFVVFTGDNIAAARKENLKGFLKTVRKLNVPVYLVIGDRDVSKEKGLNKETYREEAFRALGFGQSLNSSYVFKKKKRIFIVLDGAKEFVTAGNGYYKQDTIDWLDKQLTKYKDKKVVLLQHFPILDSENVEHNTYKVQLYRDMLKKHDNILAIVSGHFNSNLEENKYGVLNIVTPSYNVTGDYKIFDIPEDNRFVFTQLRNVE